MKMIGTAGRFNGEEALPAFRADMAAVQAAAAAQLAEDRKSVV